ncbi:MAG TPA: hypothetical protein VEK08_04040 [Planctomycetota bacterium]|nr:hypothetical protein [Planctomycetota bacterium]
MDEILCKTLQSVFSIDVIRQNKNVTNPCLSNHPGDTAENAKLAKVLHVVLLGALGVLGVLGEKKSGFRAQNPCKSRVFRLGTVHHAPILERVSSVPLGASQKCAWLSRVAEPVATSSRD